MYYDLIWKYVCTYVCLHREALEVYDAKKKTIFIKRITTEVDSALISRDEIVLFF